MIEFILANEAPLELHCFPAMFMIGDSFATWDVQLAVIVILGQCGEMEHLLIAMVDFALTLLSPKGWGAGLQEGVLSAYCCFFEMKISELLAKTK